MPPPVDGSDSNALSRKTRANATITFAYDTLNRLVHQDAARARRW
jgi:hypothetical protein